MALPPKLQAILDVFAEFTDPADRTNLLLSYADVFKEVPSSIATRPFARECLVPHCESEAYVWADVQANGTMVFHFAVENPSGISAKALATILTKSLNGLRPEDIVQVTPDIVEQIFRQNISMGKGMGLMSMVEAIRTLAKRQLSKSQP